MGLALRFKFVIVCYPWDFVSAAANLLILQFWFEKMTVNHIDVLKAEQKLAVKQEFTQQIKMHAPSATRSTRQILDQAPLCKQQTRLMKHIPAPDSLSILYFDT
ncbi:hypothetical protein G9A89_020737 [Geosiphon pyriformis]|nr:hypothetical protein G9A89_020737 [Geosiphon pyriformis]